VTRLDLTRRRLGIAGPQASTMMGNKVERHQPVRIRHETRRRTLTVASIVRLSPKMLRFSFTCPEFGDFVSASCDDHIKLFFPAGAAPVEGGRPCMRDFTPRRFDTALGTIDIDFAIHDAGPAMAWARSAEVGDTLEIGGPRGSMVVPDDFDWYLLIGDETALPAIGRRLEELRPGVPVTSFVLVEGPEDAQQISTQAAWTPHWIERRSGESDASTVVAALGSFVLPEGEGFIWIGAESSVARTARTYLTEARGHPKHWTKAAGYWKRGEADAHERIDD
jgi:NADPH-dependent ferric siderophore reductase